MAATKNLTGTVNTVDDVVDGKMVTLTITSIGPVPDEISERAREARARARALVGAGFADEGYIRDLNFRLKTPELRRRTEILGSDQVGDNSYRYEVKVNSGPILE